MVTERITCKHQENMLQLHKLCELFDFIPFHLLWTLQNMSSFEVLFFLATKTPLACLSVVQVALNSYEVFSYMTIE